MPPWSIMFSFQNVGSSNTLIPGGCLNNIWGSSSSSSSLSGSVKIKPVLLIAIVLSLGIKVSVAASYSTKLNSSPSSIPSEIVSVSEADLLE